MCEYKGACCTPVALLHCTAELYELLHPGLLLSPSFLFYFENTHLVSRYRSLHFLPVCPPASAIIVSCSLLVFPPSCILTSCALLILPVHRRSTESSVPAVHPSTFALLASCVFWILLLDYWTDFLFTESLSHVRTFESTCFECWVVNFSPLSVGTAVT